MAQVDYFLKLDGIEGESTDDKHKGEIDVTSLNFGATQQGTHGSGGGGGAGKVHVHDIDVVTKASKATPKLMEACASGQHIKSAVLVARKAGGDQQEYLKITLTDVLISGYQISGSGAHVIPQELMHMNFGKIEIEYKEQKSDGGLAGAVKAGFDLKANVKV
jgi:type VI secretion system secreted protein Hcp